MRYRKRKKKEEEGRASWVKHRRDVNKGTKEWEGRRVR